MQSFECSSLCLAGTNCSKIFTLNEYLFSYKELGIRKAYEYSYICTTNNEISSFALPMYSRSYIPLSIQAVEFKVYLKG